MKIIIIGGFGFIGFNTFLHFSKNKKNKIFIIDSLTGESSKRNFLLFKKLKYKNKYFILDIKNYYKTFQIIKKINPDAVLVLSGQVAVTKSILNPVKDLNDNFIGFFNVLEIVRKLNKKIKLIAVSSNKVYGDLKNLKIYEKKNTYNSYKTVDENFSLNFRSPYACSKGAADQYFLDYSRVYGLKTIVLRLSCIYGKHQWGTVDQGWISWFINKNLKNEKIQIFGNGKQVRDILYIDDLTKLFEKCLNKIEKCKGQVFNVGGGKINKISVLELLKLIENFTQNKNKYSFKKERHGDQKYFVNNISKIKKFTGWKPLVNKKQGIKKYYDWIMERD